MKRKREADVQFQQQALPISSEILSSITPTTKATDAETYLALVKRQAMEGGPVMFVPKISYDETVLSKCTASQSTKPNSELSGALLRQVNEIEEEYYSQQDILEETEPSSTSSVLPGNFTAWHAYFLSKEPSHEFLVDISHPQLIMLLTYAAKWISPKSSTRLLHWIYGLLLRCPAVLETSEVATIRGLGLRARKLYLDLTRSERDDNDTCDATGHKEDSKTNQMKANVQFGLLLIVAIVGRVFAQTDLLLGISC